jgi:hypothetical protein
VNRDWFGAVVVVWMIGALVATLWVAVAKVTGALP